MNILSNDRLLSDRFVWDPAGSDRALSAACDDVRAGRFAAARDLLAATGKAWDLRSHRLLVLAQAAGGNDVAGRWAAEEPGSVDAAALAARMAVGLAVRAHRQAHPHADDLAARARAACFEAAQRYPTDPTPWAAMLHLASVIPEPSPGPLETSVDGPWYLVGQLWLRDRYHREGHYRLVAAVAPRVGGRVAGLYDVARWASEGAPSGCALHLLPLLAHLEAFRRIAANDVYQRVVQADRQWGTAAARLDAQRAYEHWFSSSHRSGEPLLADLHYLAHALLATGQFDEAKQVFAAIGPYALTAPWSLFGDAAQVLALARSRCGHGPPIRT